MKQWLIIGLIVLYHTVLPNETLQSIAEHYCPGNDPQQIDEFREGIRELNYDQLGELEVWPKLVLEIHKWQ